MLPVFLLRCPLVIVLALNDEAKEDIRDFSDVDRSARIKGSSLRAINHLAYVRQLQSFQYIYHSICLATKGQQMPSSLFIWYYVAEL